MTFESMAMVIVVWLACGLITALLMRWNSRQWTNGVLLLAVVLGPAGWLVTVGLSVVAFLIAVLGNRGGF